MIGSDTELVLVIVGLTLTDSHLLVGNLILLVDYDEHMSERATIRVPAPNRDEARVTKAKLGMTWGEFLDRAADELDPDTEASG